jgi:threonine dehydrogenase-like Zn-dependent dehydrogenase
MKAAQITARRKIEVIDVPEPGLLEDGEVKVDVEYISVCGSDIYLEYDAPLDEEEYPLAPGRPVHECAGTVAESRDPGYKAGERVIVIPRQAAGAAEYVVQKQDRIIRLPEWGGLDEWVMCQHSGTALFSAKKWGNAAGKRIAVLGQGGIGLSFTMFAEKQGAVQIVGIDLEEYRCKKSLELGATGTINASNDDVLEAGKEITHGELFDVVVDATGNPAGLDTSVGLVRPQGQVISFSLVGERSVPFNHRGWMAKNLQINSTLIAATGQPVQEIRQIVALRDRGWIDPGVLKTHEMSFDEVYDAYEMYRKREDGVIKIALRLG